MRILCVVQGSPSVPAAKNKRVRQFAEGFALLGHEVSMLYLDTTGCISPQPVKAGSIDVCIEEIVLPIAVPRAGVFGTLLRNYYAGRAFDGWLKEGKGDRKFDLFYVYGQSFLIHRGGICLARASNSRYVLDQTEWFPLTPRSILSPAYWDGVLFNWLTVRKSDLVVCITRELEGLCRTKKARKIVIPAMSSNIEQSTSVQGVNKSREQIRLGYIGILQERDLPQVMFNAVERLNIMGYATELIVIGNASRYPAATEYSKRAQASEVLSRAIRFTGWLSDEELEKVTQDVDVFVLLRRDTRYARACFATRIPEFLEVGGVMVSTDVGDIGHYLTSGADCFLLAPKNQEDQLVEVLRSIHEEREILDVIRPSARQVAREKFSHIRHCSRLMARVHDISDVKVESGPFNRQEGD